MSNFLAIATVTTTLKQVLQESVEKDMQRQIDVTTLSPDESDQGSSATAGVNIFLYQVTPSSALRNSDLPTRNTAGALVQRPQAALDLHYLLSFYGSESELEPQRLLGSVVRTLHTQPLLTAAMIEDTIDAVTEGNTTHYLLSSDLAQAVERVKFAPESMSLEALSQLWSVLFQTPYALSVVYTASVVLIEADVTPGRVLPVRKRSISVFPFQKAIIEEVVSANGSDAPIEMGSTVLVKGTQLGGSIERVRVGDAKLPAASIRTSELRVNLTDSALRAGVLGLQVLYTNDSSSNMIAFVLRPVITVDASKVTATTIEIAFEPAVDRDQTVVLYLNEKDPPSDGSRPPYTYSFKAPTDNGITDAATEATTAIAFAIEDVEPAEYLVGVQVAGADSVLIWNETSGFTGPAVTIT